ncbi:MAG: threonine aldolase family protein [Actinobacteria bacterium]|nr:threonine aldolase family protein [Actinomycetota bacterium]
MKYIDLRSDTVTEPTVEMLDAMRNAIVGDDVYGDDPTVNLLESKSAYILGKEAALFLPSGTFGNQLALLTHTARGDEVLLAKNCHILLHEVGASAVIAGVQLRLLNDELGKFNIEELKNSYREEDIHHPRTGLVCMENATSDGTVVPLKNIEEVHSFTKLKDLPLHLDGARIFNAAIALKTDAREIAKYFDSIMFCFSKGLCCPIGSVLAGNNVFINKARKNRKLMGGGMRQAGFIAAPCLVALDKMTERLDEDHQNARYLADCLTATGVFEVNERKLDINMVFFKLNEKKLANKNFKEKDFLNYLYKNKIKASPRYSGEFRFVTHYWISKNKIDYLIDIIKKYLKVIRA